MNALIRSGFVLEEGEKAVLPPVFAEAVKGLPEQRAIKEKILEAMERLEALSDAESLFLSEALLKGCTEICALRESKAFEDLLYHVFLHMEDYREEEIRRLGERLLNRTSDNERYMEVCLKLLEGALLRAADGEVTRIIQREKAILKKDDSAKIKALYFESCAAFFDMALDGAYDAETREEKHKLKKLLSALLREAECLEDMEGEEEMRIRAFLSLSIILSRSHPERDRDIYAYLKEVAGILRETKTKDMSLVRDYYMALAWTKVYVHPELDKMELYLMKALKAEKERAPEDIGIMEFVVPAANMYLEMGEYEKSLVWLQIGIVICDKRSEAKPYRRMREELLSHKRDVYEFIN